MSDKLSKELRQAYGRFWRDHHRLRDELMASLPERPGEPVYADRGGRVWWRIGEQTMRRRMSIIAAAIAATILVVLGFWPNSRSNGLAWANVMKLVRDARSLQYTIVDTDESSVTEETKVLFKEPSSLRLEKADGTVWILDLASGESLIARPDTQEAVLFATSSSDKVNQVEAITRLVESDDAEPLGTEEIEGHSTYAFCLANDMLVWVDSETHVPVRIEMDLRSWETVDGVRHERGKRVLKDFVFDSSLDDSLFSLTTPEGYRLSSVDSDPQASRVVTGQKLNKIALACFKYAADHNNECPDDLAQLGAYGITAEDLVNPTRPAQSPGFIYIKPASLRVSDAMDRIMLYEAYDTWGDGIHVAYLDGLFTFVTDQSQFKKNLELTMKAPNKLK